MNKRERNKLREQLIERFSDLVFEEETHFYGLKSDRDFRFKLSCSSISKLCKKPFEREKWLNKGAEDKAKEEAKRLKEEGVIKRVTKQKLEELKEIEKEKLDKNWTDTNKTALERGTVIHQALENELQGQVWLENELIPKKTIVDIRKWLVKNGYQLIAAELRMFDKELAISGTMDLLAYNKFTKKYYIIDWKTNKHKPITKIETYIDKKTGEVKQSNFKFEKPFNHLPQSKYYEYSMQLSTYKLILERNFDIKIEGIILVQISDVLYPEGFCIIPGELLPVNKLFNI